MQTRQSPPSLYKILETAPLGGYSPSELSAIRLLLLQFSWSGQIHLLKFLRTASQLKERRPFHHVLGAIRLSYEAVWKHDPAERRGDPDDLAVGLRNASLIARLYVEVGLPHP